MLFPLMRYLSIYLKNACLLHLFCSGEQIVADVFETSHSKRDIEWLEGWKSKCLTPPGHPLPCSFTAYFRCYCRSSCCYLDKHFSVLTSRQLEGMSRRNIGQIESLDIVHRRFWTTWKSIVTLWISEVCCRARRGRASSSKACIVCKQLGMMLLPLLLLLLLEMLPAAHVPLYLLLYSIHRQISPAATSTRLLTFCPIWAAAPLVLNNSIEGSLLVARFLL